jgi:hypothetical protein
MAEAKKEKASSDSENSMGFGMWATIKTIRAKFPKVKDISTDTLAQMLQAASVDESVVMLVSCIENHICSLLDHSMFYKNKE